MPTIFHADGFRFFFYSNEGDPREPVHVHVIGNGGEAKLWLRPDVAVARSARLDARSLRQVTRLADARREEIERAWHDYFG